MASANAPSSRLSAAAAPPPAHALSQIVADQLRDHLGVGLGLEAVALGDQLVAQHLEILDDAVVHDRDAARLVGVRVVAGRRAVRRPAGVADPDHAGQRLLLERPLEVDELPSARRRSMPPLTSVPALS